MRPETKLFCALVALGLMGCPVPGGGGGTGGGSGAVGGGAGGSGGSGGGDGGGSVGLAASAKGVVRFKRNERLANDFSQALGLPPASLCLELGKYSCTALVHPLALGGVDPYGIGLYEPLPFTGVTTPIVVDRVALAGCIQRVNADLTTPASAVIFKNITIGADGKIADLDSAPVKDALESLYERVMLRPITDAERAHFTQLYRDIDASGKPDTGKSWLTLSCFSVLTSTESLFY